jgi:hypothetical protein
VSELIAATALGLRPEQKASHDSAVPDDLDYEWFRRFLTHSEAWTKDDLAIARDMLASQKRAVGETHPKDRKNRQELQEVVDALRAAIETHLASGG